MKLSKTIVCTIITATAMANAADALGGDGDFYYNEYVPTSWSLNVKGGARMGAIEGEYDGDYNYVLKFWSNGPTTYDYYIQALHKVPLEYGYSYQIEALGYYFYNDETGETNYGASIGIQSSDGEIQYLSDELSFSPLDAIYTSKTYKHCDASDKTANLYINAGHTVGDFTDEATPHPLAAPSLRNPAPLPSRMANESAPLPNTDNYKQVPTHPVTDAFTVLVPPGASAEKKYKSRA